MGAHELAGTRSGRWPQFGAFLLAVLALTGVLFVALPEDNPKTQDADDTSAAERDRRSSGTSEPVAVKSATETRERLVVFGDSHSSSETSWVAGVKCMDVMNLSVPASGLLASGMFGSLHARLPDLVDELKPDDTVVFAMGFNDFDQHSVEELAREQQAMTQMLEPKVAHVYWATVPPFSKDRPMGFSLDLLRSRRLQWNQYLMTTPGAIDLSAPLGDDLEPSEDSGDHVHLSPAAQLQQQNVAAQALCGRS